MISETEIFNLSGPLHLSAPEWTRNDHRRSIAACLVQGVYILEYDRQQKRQGLQALAPPWWDFFHFRLIRVLIDDKDRSIFGAVYEFKQPSDTNHPAHSPPKYVIAFRGTVTRSHTRLQDLKLDLHCIFDKLRQSPRFDIALRCVKEFVALAGPQNIWLAGHSLGSAIALSVGKNMIKSSESHIETYLFNPPFISILGAFEKVNSLIKKPIRITTNIITAGVTGIITGLKNGSETNEPNSFRELSTWIPNLFVNSSDVISSGYIGHFKNKPKIMRRYGSMGRLANQNSIYSLFSGENSEPGHLLPSAYLGVNMSAPYIMKAHGIEQWWDGGNLILDASSNYINTMNKPFG